jgi:8-oxo-dGTP diphosphatase
MIPRLGESVVRNTQYRLRPGAYVILPRDRQVLLTVQHSDTQDFQLPGGGIDPDEHVIAALHREVREETGWRISKPRRIGAFRRFVFMPEYGFWAEKLCHIFVARPVYKIGEPSEPDHSAQWVDLSFASQVLGNEGDRFFMSRFVHSGVHL